MGSNLEALTGLPVVPEIVQMDPSRTALRGLSDRLLYAAGQRQRDGVTRVETMEESEFTFSDLLAVVDEAAFIHDRSGILSDAELRTIAGFLVTSYSAVPKSGDNMQRAFHDATQEILGYIRAKEQRK